MRISDWSSDVCSSDLIESRAVAGQYQLALFDRVFLTAGARSDDNEQFEDSTSWRTTTAYLHEETATKQIGRASCRERVCQYVSISVVAVSLKNKKNILTNNVV